MNRSRRRPTLRPATRHDEGHLLAWRNDPDTRAASFTEDEVTPEAHARWLTSKLTDRDCALLIVEDEGRPIGQVRLERVDDRVAEIHIGLAPEARGTGLGRAALSLACEDAPNLLGVSEVRALVRRENEASLRAFRAAGFAEVATSREAVELRRATVGSTGSAAGETT